MILVTGASGFIGRALVGRLVAGGQPVRALVRSDAGAKLVPAGAEVVRGDVADVESLRRAAAGVDLVFHLAGSYRGSTDELRAAHVTGTANLVGAEMCMPGDNVKMSVELHKPIAMDDGVRFAIREGGRTVGSGVVTKILE